MKRNFVIKTGIGIILLFLIISFGISNSAMAYGSNNKPVSYTVNYYVNSMFQESETITTTDYDKDRNAVVTYKTAPELNLTSDYKVKGDVVKTITLNLSNNKNNKINIFYSNGTIAKEDPWKRSVENSKKSGGKAVEVISLATFNGWTWNDAGKIKMSVTDEALIWDEGQYYDGYVKPDLKRGFPYATWVRQSSGDKRDIRRFQTVITVPEGYDGNDFVRMKSVNQDAYMDINNGNIVPINDNIFVFVYPEGTAVNNNNYLSYLAFWAGTESQSGKKAYFKDILGNPAYQNTGLAELRQTDGWHIYATIDNVGEKLVGANPGDRYVIDIFTQDYAEGGGMDKYEFEFIKNKAPKAEDDFFITAKGETFNLTTSNNGGILDNDFIYVPEAGAKAELITDSKLRKVSDGVYNIYDDNNKLGGTIKNFDGDKGLFVFTPNSNYMGVLKFKYECYQKKIGQNVVDTKLKDNAEVTIYVLPKVTAEHKQAKIKNGEIDNISSGTLKENDVVYGWSSNLAWNNNWIWPENAFGINRTADKKSSYEVSSYTFPNHDYIGYKNDKNTVVADSSNSSKILNGTFTSENKKVAFYYEIGKSNLIVESYIKGTNTLLDRQSMSLDSGSPYKVDIPDIPGYTYDSSNVSLSGTMPKNGLTVKLYYTANMYNYSVQYYFDDVLKHEITYSKPYGSEVKSYLKAEQIESLEDIVNSGYEFVRDENVPLTIGNSQNVIKVYYEKKNSDLNWFYMYPNVNISKDNYQIPLINNPDYNEYNILRGFDYTFGFNFNAAHPAPDIIVDYSDSLNGSIDNFRIYDEDGNRLYPAEGVNKGSFPELVNGHNLTRGKNYTVVFRLKYDKPDNNLTIEINGDIDSTEVINKIKLNPIKLIDVE